VKLTAEQHFESKLNYIRQRLNGVAHKLETASWQFMPEEIEALKYEVDSLIKRWADIKAKPESEGDKCPSK
jgi:hypothetical protein